MSEFSIEEFYDKLETELTNQDLEHGKCDYHPLEWISILSEEVGEISKELNDVRQNVDKMNLEAYEHEIIQSAAVLVQMWRNIESYKKRRKENE